MKKISLIILMAALGLMGQNSYAQSVERAEPLSWWVGMSRPLQIMFYGEGIGKVDKVLCLETGVSVSGLHRAESPNYLFVDVAIDKEAAPGLYTFEFTSKQSNGKSKKTQFQYRIDPRKDSSASRGSFAASDMVYLLMPDRFSDGDTTNNNNKQTLEQVNRADPHGRHGGDIQGIINRLDYLVELGVTTLWSTPMLLDDESTYSYHGYATSDYYRIDPRFGSNELYRTMIDEAHKRNIKVIMDMVPNHCGGAHPWMKDLPFGDWINSPENQKSGASAGSPNSFTQTNNVITSSSDPNASQTDIKECVEGWFDRPMPDINLRNEFVFNYFVQWAIWWIEWGALDGLRVDTFPYSDKFQIAKWVGAILDEYQNLNIVGEVWINSPVQVAYWDGASKNRDGYNSNLKSVMDFPLQQAIIEAFDTASTEWGGGLTKVYNVLAQDFVYDDPRTLLIFAGNHDTDRLAHFVKSDPDKAKLIMTLLATIRGVPQLYYGDELLFLGDQKEGHGGQRIDFPGGWNTDKTDLFDSSQRSVAEQQLHEHTKQLFNWRKGTDAIHSGKTLHFIPKHNLYVYFRHTDKESVMVMINGSNTAQQIDWSRFSEGTEGYNSGVDIINDTDIELNQPLTISPLSSMVLELKR